LFAQRLCSAAVVLAPRVCRSSLYRICTV